MITTSYLILTLGSIFFLCLGWLFYHLIKNKGAKNWSSKYAALENEHNVLSKKLNKESKAVEQFRQKAESWKHEYHALTQEKNQLASSHVKDKKFLTDQLDAINNDTSKLKKANQDLEGKLQRTNKELEKLKEKYSLDVVDGKEWKVEREELVRESKSLKSKLERQLTISNDYKTKYEKQAVEINKVRVLERELRMLKTKCKKFETDISYWEKKHYDTHHELAELKKTYQTLKADFDNVSELRKGDKVLKDNLMSQIQEFKTKFVNINNKYREVMQSHN